MGREKVVGLFTVLLCYLLPQTFINAGILSKNRRHSDPIFIECDVRNIPWKIEPITITLLLNRGRDGMRHSGDFANSSQKFDR
jgi:hypothetical protein